MAALTWTAAPCADQPTPRLTPSPAASLLGEFTHVTALRELADGSLLVVDAAEQRLVHLEPAMRRLTSIGRPGRGPGEYENLQWLAPLGGDSTLAADSRAQRPLVLEGPRIVATLPPNSALASSLGYAVRGGDTTGRLLLLRLRLRPRGELRDPDDSVTALVGHLTGARLDTVATLAGILGRRQRVQRRQYRPMYVINPLRVDEQAVLCPDGWIAVARLAPYRIEWRAPNGRHVTGAPLAVMLPRVSAAEKRAALARAPGSLQHLAPGDLADWPRVLPPFQREGLVCAPGGRLLVHRMPAARDTTTLYDVIDHAGARVAQLVLPANETIVGAGRAAVYAVVRDGNGVQRLRRYGWTR